MTARWVLAAVGALAGLCLYGLSELWTMDVLTDRTLLALTAFGVAFFGGTLAMSGPLRLLPAASGAALVGVAAAAFLVLASWRFASAGDTLDAIHPLAAAFALGTLPLPFWIAAKGPGWTDYPTLFAEAWAMAMRAAAAGLFVAAAWALIFLSDAMLSLVDLPVIEEFIDLDPVPWVISGAVTGLALAVMGEISDVLSPDIAIRFLRILLPAVLLVVAIFVIALPLKGFTGLGGLSVGTTLLAMVAVSVTLISAAVERDRLLQVDGPLMTVTTRALALLLPLPAAMAGFAVWLRVADAGWSPARVAAATAVAVALAYGIAYLVAALFADWAARIRAANTWLAVLVVLVAAFWLTPVLNAEAIAARSQVARYLAGRTPVAELDLWALSRWGRPGERAIAALEAAAGQPGQQDLAARLADRDSWGLPAAGPDPDVARAELARLMPVTPATALAERDRLVAALEPWEVEVALSGCRAPLASGAPGCVLAVADFWPGNPGNEAALFSRSEGGWLRVDGFVPRDGGVWERHGVLQGDGRAVAAGEVEAVILRLQSGPPVMRPTQMNSLDTGVMPVTIIP